VNFFYRQPKQRDRCRIFNRFIARIQIAQPARRQEHSGFLLGLKEPKRREPKKDKQKYSLENGARDSGDCQADRSSQSHGSKGESFASFAGTEIAVSHLRFLVIPAKAGIQVRGFAPHRSLDARLRGHDETSLRLKARDFNHPRKGH